MSSQPAPSPSATLFPPDHQHRLSELDLDPRFGFHFGIGYLLALPHGDGVANRDLNPSQLKLRSGTGLCYVMTWKREDHPLAPRSMAPDFVKPFQTFSPPAFQALLAGYIQAAWIQLEPLQTGYVNGLLKTLGGTPQNVPAPVPVAFDLAAQLRATLNAKLVWQENRLTLVGLPESNVGQFSPNTLVLGLALAELEIAPTVDARVASAIRAVPAELKSPSNAQTVGVVLNLITTGKLNSAAAGEMADAFDTLAQLCDAANQPRPSLKFAQMSIMLRAAIPGSAAEFELRCLTTMARHARLSWFPKLLAPEQKDSLITLAQLAYANTRAAFFLKAFDSSCPPQNTPTQTNRLWSVLFKTLTLTRLSIVAIQSMPISDDNLKTSAGVFAIAAVQRLQAAYSKLLTPQVEFACAGAPAQLQSKEVADEMAWVSKVSTAMKNAGGQANPPACYAALLASPYTQSTQFLGCPFTYWK